MDASQTSLPSQQESAKGRKLQFSMRTAFVTATVLIVLLNVGAQVALQYHRKSKLVYASSFHWKQNRRNGSRSPVQASPPTGFWGTLFYDLGIELVPVHTIEYTCPPRGEQRYTVVDIDTSQAKDGDVLAIRIAVGGGAGASVDLFDGDTDLSEGRQEQARRSDKNRTSAYNISRGGAAVIHHFVEGKNLKLGVTGTWNDGSGTKNTAIVAVHAIPFDALDDHGLTLADSFEATE